MDFISGSYVLPCQRSNNKKRYIEIYIYIYICSQVARKTRNTTFVMSQNNSTRIDTLMLAFPHAATGITPDFDVTWDYPENNHLPILFPRPPAASSPPA